MRELRHDFVSNSVNISVSQQNSHQITIYTEEKIMLPNQHVYCGSLCSGDSSHAVILPGRRKFHLVTYQFYPN